MAAHAPLTKLRQSRTHPGSCRNPALWLRERTVTESTDLLAAVIIIAVAATTTTMTAAAAVVAVVIEMMVAAG